MMIEYFMQFYVEHIRGIGYVLTHYILIAAVVLLLNDCRKSPRGVLLKLLEIIACIGCTALFTAAYYAVLGDIQMDRVSILVFLVIYAAFFSRYEVLRRVVYACVFYACFMVILPVSEPLGEVLRGDSEVQASLAQYLTPLVVGVMTGAIVWFLRHFSIRYGKDTQLHFVWLLVTVSVLTVLTQVANLVLQPSRAFNVIVSCALWIIELLTYYLLYSVTKVNRENRILAAMRHKAEMEMEKYEVTRMNYDDLRAIRHEIKNHNFYMQSLLEAGKYDELREYLRQTADSDIKQLQTFDCGNYLIDVVMNHEMSVAESQGVRVRSQIVVPHTLPFEDSDLCSLLSNLMDNAIEAAVQSGKQNPVMDVSILPRQDYLFIRVRNDVDESIPRQQRLTLKTTKQSRELHGYGTKVIRTIAEKCNGTVSFQMEKDRFITDVMLQLPKEEDHE